MEATLFSGWIYDVLKPFAAELQMGHPAMMKAIGASKKKNDKLDARKIAHLVRCNLLPACYVAPAEIRELRRMLRYRNLVVAQATRMKNKVSGLLMEVGAEYNKQRLHGKQYFTELMESLEEVPESVKDLLRLSRAAMETFETTQEQLVVRLQKEPLLLRVMLLKSIRGVGPVTSLTWILEVGDPHRFSSVAHAVSYCGLTSALDSSADNQKRGPISKQRNAHLQTVLIEAAKLAPRWNPQLAAIHAREVERGESQPATLAVARKLVAYLLAVDKSGQPFQPRTPWAAETEVEKFRSERLEDLAIRPASMSANKSSVGRCLSGRVYASSATTSALEVKRGRIQTDPLPPWATMLSDINSSKPVSGNRGFPWNEPFPSRSTASRPA
jgi:transposase